MERGILKFDFQAGKNKIHGGKFITRNLKTV